MGKCITKRILIVQLMPHTDKCLYINRRRAALLALMTRPIKWQHCESQTAAGPKANERTE